MNSQEMVKRATMPGLVLFVMFPLAATGSLGGSIFGRLPGMSRLGTFMGIALGNFLGCALMDFGSELITHDVGRDNPLLLICAIAVITALLLVLNNCYRQLKNRRNSCE